MKNNKMLLIESINAITSWEDYEYQGHVALYVALKKICELLCCGEKISMYELQIEGEEDFSIRKDNKYISLHQVKAGAIRLEDNDKFSFLMGILQNDAEYGYFHISNGKSIPKDFVSVTLSYINMLKVELKKKVIEQKNLKSTDRENDYIILDKISRNHKKADIYSIIKFASGNSKNITKVKATINNIDKALDIYKANIEQTIEQNPLKEDDEVFLCIYGERFDNTKQIRLKAYEIIVDILKKECPNYTFVDVDYAALVYDQLLLHMKERITDFNIKNNKNEKCILTFDEMLEHIVVDYHEKIDTVAYQYFQVLKSIRDTYADYPSEQWSSCSASNCKDCQESNTCNLFKQINILNNKPEDERNEIIHNLLLKTPQVGRSNNLPCDNLISHLFLNLLDEIKSLGLGKNNVYETTKNGIKTYRMTLDSSFNVYDFQKNLKKEFEKETNKSLLYECDVLITDRLCENALFFNGGDINVLNEKELNEISGITSSTVEKMKKDCNRPKIIRLIDRKGALGELKS